MDDASQHLVVLNDEEQYSIWPAHREVPDGWRAEGVRGTREECLSHIGRAWTDMRPLSLRRQMEEWARNPPPEPEHLPIDETPPLVQRLAGGDHRAEVRTSAEDKLAYLRDRLDVGYLHVFFPDTRGGTELGIKLESDSVKSALQQIASGGDVSLSGYLVLDGVEAMCRVRLRTPDLLGQGGLSVRA